MTLAEAIARQEGFGKPKTIATLNHNPGNIIAGAFSAGTGATGKVHGYAVYPTDAFGWAALTELLTGPGYRGLNVEQAINKFCPPPDGSALTAGNEPDVYVQNVCAWLGVSPSTPIAGLLA
jgi:hypothetical protein